MKLYYLMRELEEMFNVSRTTIWRWIRNRGFPPPERFGEMVPVARYDRKHGTGRKLSTKAGNCQLYFPVEEVHAWDAARKQARHPSKEGNLKLVSTTS